MSHGHTAAGYAYTLKHRLPRGWYILVVKYHSTELRNFIRFRSGRGGYTQGLNVRPLTRRIRIVRLSHCCQPLIELESDDSLLYLSQLTLRKISACQAWHLVFKKLSSKHPMYAETKRISSRSSAWRDYNRLQHGRFYRSQLTTYRDWIRMVEPMLKSAPALADIEPDIQRRAVSFVHASESDGSVDPAPHGTWVIATVSHQIVAQHAENELICLITSNPECKVIYTDYDRISPTGTRYGPNFKPSLNIDLAYSDPMYSVGCVIRADVWNEALARFSDYSSKYSAYGVFLESLVLVKPEHVFHLPKILFHLVDPSYPAGSLDTRFRASNDSISTVRRFLEVHYPSLQVDVQLVKDGMWGQQVTWALPERPLLVSILLPTRDSFQLISACIASLFSVAAGVDYELIIVDNGTVDRDALALLASLELRHNVTIIRDDGPFNYSALVNQGARVAKGDVLCLLNNDTKVITQNWLALLSAHALRAEVGCVGPMLLYADYTVQHAGVVLGIGGIAGHAHKYFSSEAQGFQARLQLCHNFSAVTGACLVVRRSLWCSLDGFDEVNLPVNYNDVDFCLRVLSAGYRNLYVPQVKLCHYESKSRGSPLGAAFKQWQDERKIMLRRWGRLIESDPAYSPHLSLSHEDFSLSLKVENISARSFSSPLGSP